MTVYSDLIQNHDSDVLEKYKVGGTPMMSPVDHEGVGSCLQHCHVAGREDIGKIFFRSDCWTI